MLILCLFNKKNMDENNKLRILFESITSKFDYLSNADNCIDGKAETLMGFEIALGICYLAFIIGGLEGIEFYMGVVGLVSLAISIVLLLFINWPKDYTSMSVNITEHREYLDKSEKDLLLQLISDAQNAFTKNSKILKTKAKFYRFAVTFLIISSFLLMLSKVDSLPF